MAHFDPHDFLDPDPELPKDVRASYEDLEAELTVWRKHFPHYKVVDGKLCYSGQMTADSASVEPCGFKLFGSIPCELGAGHAGDHTGISGVGERVRATVSEVPRED